MNEQKAPAEKLQVVRSYTERRIPLLELNNKPVGIFKVELSGGFWLEPDNPVDSKIKGVYTTSETLGDQTIFTNYTVSNGGVVTVSRIRVVGGFQGQELRQKPSAKDLLVSEPIRAGAQISGVSEDGKATLEFFELSQKPILEFSKNSIQALK